MGKNITFLNIADFTNSEDLTSVGFLLHSDRTFGNIPSIFLWAFLTFFLLGSGGIDAYGGNTGPDFAPTRAEFQSCVPTAPVEIKADFCAPGGIELTSVNAFSSYTWRLNGVIIGYGRTILTDIAGTYFLTVKDSRGCTATTSLQTSEELVTNGDFENGFQNTFRTDYTNAEVTKSLQPEGYFVVDRNARDYHSNFYGYDHTTGNGKFLILNGHPDQNKVIWEQTVEVRPNINYYFSAWGVNLHSSNPARLQFTVNGVPTGTIADLTGKPIGEWMRFHSPQFWNSGSATKAVIRIINLNTTRNGNDFGLDDISFGNLDPIPFSVNPPESLTICPGQDLQLFANLDGGREPLEFTWRRPDGSIFSTEENPVIENVSHDDLGTYTVSVLDFYGCESPAQIGETEVVFDQNCFYLDFDGNDDHIRIGNDYNFEDTFTIEAWVKPHSLNAARSIVSKSTSDIPSEGGFSLSLNNGYPEFKINDQVLSSQYRIGSDRWYHVVGSFNGTTAKIYIDGIETGSAAMQKPIHSAIPVMIGAQYNLSKPWTAENYFHGWMEELRIWGKALSPTQIRFMMNQRIENNNAAVKGAEIPLNVPEELVWADLEGYYPLLTQKVLEGGITQDLSLNKIDGQLRNMKTSQQNTAPLPYFTVREGNWTEVLDTQESPWAHPAVWNAPNTSGVNNEMIDWNIVETSHNVSSGASNITLLGLNVEDATLSITNPNGQQDEYNPGISIRITDYLRLDGVMDLVGESQLLQDEGSILEESSTGYIERDQQGTASSFNYNYWSSPVSPVESSNNSPYTVEKVLRDGTNSSSPIPLVFDQNYAFADKPYSGAKRISSYWLNIYTNKTSNTYSEWFNVKQNGNVKPGEGFSMKGTSGTASIEDPQNYVFVGKPYNGTIQLQVNAGSDYLIGNPYPSALDAYQFIRDNIKESGGTNPKNIFNGTLYFWDHFSGKTHYLQEYIGGYATLNLSGGIEAVATDHRINATGEHADPNKIPQQYIPVGQAFYVSTQVPSSLEGLTTVEGGLITFNNNQRSYETDDQEGDRSIFKSQTNVKSQAAEKDDRQKIYLRFKSPAGYNRQILVTRDINTSTGFDLGYDAPLIENNKEDMYWMISNVRFVIQGVPDFDKTRALPLGIKTQIDGKFSIDLEKLLNIPDGMKIYLKDSLNEVVHDLRESAFETSVAPGKFHDRFFLVFEQEEETSEEIEIIETGEEETGEEETDGKETPPTETAESESPQIPEKEIDETDLKLSFSNSTSEINIQNPFEIPITRGILYNAIGQKLEEYYITSSDPFITVPLEIEVSGVYLFKVEMNGRSKSLRFIKE